MVLEVVTMGDVAKVIYFCKIEVLCLCDSQHFFAFYIVEELTFLVEEFEGIPLFWVVTCSKDDTTSSVETSYSELCGWGSSETNIDHVIAHTY